MTDDDPFASFHAELTFSIAPGDMITLAEEISRAGGLDKPFDRYRLEVIVTNVATHFRAMRWLAAQGYLGRDTLDELGGHVSAVVNLLTHKVNRNRLIRRLLGHSPFVDLETTRKVYETILSGLAVIGTVAPREHRGRTRGHPVIHPEVNEAFRVAVGHFKLIFGDEMLRGRAAWSRTKPPQAKHLSAVFLYGVMKLAAPDRPALAEEVRNLMEKEVTSLRGLRPGRQHR